jgi:hypothetical protein
MFGVPLFGDRLVGVTEKDRLKAELQARTYLKKAA